MYKLIIIFLTSAGRAQVSDEHWSKGCRRWGGCTQLLALAGNPVWHIQLIFTIKMKACGRSEPKYQIVKLNFNQAWMFLHRDFCFSLRSLFSTYLAAPTTTHVEELWSREAGLWLLLTVWTGNKMMNYRLTQYSLAVGVLVLFGLIMSFIMKCWRGPKCKALEVGLKNKRQGVYFGWWTPEKRTIINPAAGRNE